MLPARSLRPETAHASLRVAVVDAAPGFAALRDEWEELLRDSAADGVFLTWEWLHTWWMHLGRGRALHILTVRDGRNLIGLAPLTRTRLTWLSRLEFLGTGLAGSDYLDIIARRDRTHEVTAAIAETLRAGGYALSLDHLPPESAIATALAGSMAQIGWTTLRRDSGICPVVPLAGESWDSYLATLGAAHRANVRRRLRALDRQFTVRFSRVHTEAERGDALRTLMALHNRRWDARGGSTAFATAECRAFHDAVTRLALERGWLRLYELRLNDEVAAATYCFAYGGRVCFYQGAFDDRFQQHSVGLAAMALTIRASIEEGAREFDMLYGVESYKWLWARRARTLQRIDLFPPDLAGRLHHRAVRTERTMRRLARRIFPRRPCTSDVPPAGVVC